MKNIIIISVAIIAIIAMAITNPSINAHIEVLSNKQLSGTVGNYLEMGLAALAGGVEYRNYLVLSVVYIGKEPVSFGVLNNVFEISVHPKLALDKQPDGSSPDLSTQGEKPQPAQGKQSDDPFADLLAEDDAQPAQDKQPDDPFADLLAQEEIQQTVHADNSAQDISLDDLLA